MRRDEKPPEWVVGAGSPARPGCTPAVASSQSTGATASRTGAVQWLLIVGLVLCWRRTGAGQPLRLALDPDGLSLLAAE